MIMKFQNGHKIEGSILQLIDDRSKISWLKSHKTGYLQRTV